MQVRVHLDPARLYRWHLVLIAEMGALRHAVTVSFVDTPEPLPASLTALFDYDRARSGAGEDRFSTRLQREAFDRYASDESGRCDLILDLSSATRTATHAGRVLRPQYDGVEKDYALYHALLVRRAPELSVNDSQGQQRGWNIGLPAIERPWRIAIAYDQIVSRLVQGVLRVLGRIEAGEQPDCALAPAVLLSSRSNILAAASAYASARAMHKVARIADTISGDGEKWYVAWRRVEPNAPRPVGELKLSDYRILPDGGTRYFADPFVFVHQGRCHVFIEDLPKETKKGRIAHFEIGADGNASAVRCVLEEPHHLSYPLVFEREGEIWMLPESSAAGGLDLYRATEFPTRWVKEARIIGKPLHDATLFEHSGRLWISAASVEYQGSCWDTMSLYSAGKVTGPWTEHKGNPLVVDARNARPAGVPVIENGRLIRPAQDCSKAYGGALVWREIRRLDENTFSEFTIGAASFPAQSKILGPHTYSRGGGYELIDFFARPSTLKALL